MDLDDPAVSQPQIEDPARMGPPPDRPSAEDPDDGFDAAFIEETWDEDWDDEDDDDDGQEEG